jgi:hypothetical protein
VSSSILNLFLQGDGMSGACSGSIKSWLCIAVSQRSAHFPTFNHAYLDVPMASPIGTEHSSISRDVLLCSVPVNYPA